MRVTIKDVQSKELFYYGKSLGVFENTSEWNGMVCFKRADGERIIAFKGPQNPLTFIFGGAQAGDIIAATPDILEQLKSIRVSACV